MEHLTPQLIAEITGGTYFGDEAGRGAAIRGAVCDDRLVAPGNLFVCVKGARVDGHAYAGKAIAAGAACVLAERRVEDANGPCVIVGSTLESIKTIGAYHRSLLRIPVIGVTGSVGKTTVKELTAAVLGAKLKVHKTSLNQNNELGVPLTLLGIGHEHEAAVVEMGVGEIGEMKSLAMMVRPDVLIMTKIGYSHLNAFTDLAGVLREKSEVFKYMDPGAAAILGGDDELLREYDPGMRRILFGVGGNCDYRASGVRALGAEAVVCDIEYKAPGTRAIGTETAARDLLCGRGGFQVTIPGYGKHLGLLMPAAVAAAHLLGLRDEEIRKGAASYSPAEGRASVIGTGQITIIDDCYNSNPHSAAIALESLSELPGRHVAIIGDMLNLDAFSDEKHREIGSLAARSRIDLLICCGDKAALVYEGYMREGGGEARYYAGKPDAARELPKLIEKGDAVLVKASRGMEFEEFIPLLKNLG